MLESVYQARLIKKLGELFPGCLVLKNDSGYRQGIPDLSVFYGGRYAFLEVKPDAAAGYEPNQLFYLDMLNRMSFAARIDPSNERDVLCALQQAFGA